MFNRFWLLPAMLCVLLFVPHLASANQVGITFSEDTLGALGDYQKTEESWEFEADAQAQRTDALSLIGNAAIQRNFGSLGVKPFVAYNRDDIGNTLDAGGLINFSVGGLDIAAGASFRGANPTGATLEKRFDAADNAVEVRPKGYNPNAYTLPEVNNINAAFKTGFEKWKVETDLTAYVPITERASVPVIIISRSQTSIKLTESLSASFVLDARSYVHADGVAIEFKPMGGVTYRF